MPAPKPVSLQICATFFVANTGVNKDDSRWSLRVQAHLLQTCDLLFFFLGVEPGKNLFLVMVLFRDFCGVLGSSIVCSTSTSCQSSAETSPSPLALSTREALLPPWGLNNFEFCGCMPIFLEINFCPWITRVVSVLFLVLFTAGLLLGLGELSGTCEDDT